MKKLAIIVFLVAFAGIAQAQRYAFVDTEYILSNIPSYTSAQEQLEKITERYQNEITTKREEVGQMYQDYQNELVFLSDEMKVKRENEIIEKEKQVRDLQQKYFGPEGELYKRRVNLIKPIQDEVFNAVKELAEEKGYSFVFDKASATGMMFADPGYDVSDEVLEKLGYTN